MALAKRKVRMESKWRMGTISQTEYDKTLEDSNYEPKENTDAERDARIHK